MADDQLTLMQAPPQVSGLTPEQLALMLQGGGSALKSVFGEPVKQAMELYKGTAEDPSTNWFNLATSALPMGGGKGGAMLAGAGIPFWKKLSEEHAVGDFSQLTQDLYDKAILAVTNEGDRDGHDCD